MCVVGIEKEDSIHVLQKGGGGGGGECIDSGLYILFAYFLCAIQINSRNESQAVDFNPAIYRRLLVIKARIIQPYLDVYFN